MGLLDMLSKHSDDEATESPSALDAAREPGAGGGVIGGAVQSLLHIAIDGRGPLAPVKKAAAKAREKAGSVEQAVASAETMQVAGAAVGGFITSLGGFASMPVALPVNVVEFYLQATRVVGKVAELRGYDSSDPQIRTAIMITLAGSQGDDLLKKLGVSGASGVAGMVENQLPEEAAMLINKGVGFQIVRSMGDRALSRITKGIPLVGGVVGAALDGYLMFRIVESAKQEFPQK